jgi:transposase
VINPDDLIGLGEIADMAGVRKNVASNWINRYDDFPKPVLQRKMGTLYDVNQVRDWLRSKNKMLVEDLVRAIAGQTGLSQEDCDRVLRAIDQSGFQIIVKRSGE